MSAASVPKSQDLAPVNSTGTGLHHPAESDGQILSTHYGSHKAGGRGQTTINTTGSGLWGDPGDSGRDWGDQRGTQRAEGVMGTRCWNSSCLPVRWPCWGTPAECRPCPSLLSTLGWNVKFPAENKACLGPWSSCLHVSSAPEKTKDSPPLHTYI